MKKLYRSHTNKYISGLCGGIGEMLRIDPTIIRLIVLALAIGSFGFVAVVYTIASFIVPKEPQDSVYYHNQYHY